MSDMKTGKHNLRLYILLAVMTFSWSGNFVMAKIGLREVPPFALVTLRLWIATALLMTIYAVRRGNLFRALAPRDWLVFTGLGFLGVTMNQGGFTVGINYTTAGHASLIIGMSPLVVLVLAVMMKMERLTPWKWVGMALSFAGVGILASEHGFGSDGPTLLGDAIILGGSLGFSLYTVLGKRVADRYDTLTLNTGSYLAGTLIATPICGWQLFRMDWSQVGLQGWSGAFYLGVMGSVTAYMIFYYALTKMEASRVSVLGYLQPVLGTLLAVAFIGEHVTSYLLAGGALILLGVYVAERGTDPHLDAAGAD